MENKTPTSQVALFEITLRIQAQNYKLRIGSAAGWIALIAIAAVRIAAHFLKGAQ